MCAISSSFPFSKFLEVLWGMGLIPTSRRTFGWWEINFFPFYSRVFTTSLIRGSSVLELRGSASSLSLGLSCPLTGRETTEVSTLLLVLFLFAGGGRIFRSGPLALSRGFLVVLSSIG